MHGDEWMGAMGGERAVSGRRVSKRFPLWSMPEVIRLTVNDTGMVSKYPFRSAE